MWRAGRLVIAATWRAALFRSACAATGSPRGQQRDLVLEAELGQQFRSTAPSAHRRLPKCGATVKVW